MGCSSVRMSPFVVRSYGYSMTSLAVRVLNSAPTSLSSFGLVSSVHVIVRVLWFVFEVRCRLILPPSGDFLMCSSSDSLLLSSVAGSVFAPLPFAPVCILFVCNCWFAVKAASGFVKFELLNRSLDVWNDAVRLGCRCPAARRWGMHLSGFVPV